jgi:hypothetical protein
MTSPPEHIDEPANLAADRALWRRCRTVNAPEDEHLRFLDLAAFAEGGLDPDEHDRIASLVQADPVAAFDVAAARALPGDLKEDPAAIARIIARAIALQPAVVDFGRVVPFLRRERQVLLRGLAQWGSLAAALAIAAWLGFTMGSDASLALIHPELTGQDASMIELFDPATGFLHDMPTGVQT